MIQPPGLETLLITGQVGEVCRLAAPPLRAVLADRCRQWGLPRHLVDDALQESFLRVLRYHHRYRPWLASAWTWLQTVAVRALIDLARQDRRRWARPLFGADGKPIEDPEAGGVPASPLEAEELIEKALLRLSPRHREVVRLRLEGHDQKTVASRLGVTPNNVGVIFHHFREEVRSLLGMG